jgi:hypothetical protein
LCAGCPIIHTLFSNIKAWLVGTHHGVSAKHLPRYLREWSYRFNRRNLPDGLDGYLIRRAVECATITYDQLRTGTLPGGQPRPAASRRGCTTGFSPIGILCLYDRYGFDEQNGDRLDLSGVSA